MPVRNNKLYECVNYHSFDASEDGEALSGFIMQYYIDNPIPREIYTNVEVSSELGAYLSEIKKATVKVYTPVKGMKKDLVRTAENNARDYIKNNAEILIRQQENSVGACENLARALGLDKIRRIECYDISHISGTDKVASGVCFIDGRKASKEYRRYKIKTVEGNNDFDCMAEVLSRRLVRAKSKDEKFTEMPDLIMVDGGKGQLSSAHGIMVSHGYDIPMIGLAKREEEIFVSGKSEPIILSHTSPELKLLQRVRDESHRFAITYHRNTRLKRIKSRLVDIEGVGEKKAKLLLGEFGSMKNISKLPLGVLESVKGLDKTSAKNIYDYFRREEKNGS